MGVESHMKSKWKSLGLRAFNHKLVVSREGSKFGV